MQLASRNNTSIVKAHEKGASYLRVLSDKTGGRTYQADGLAEIQKAFGLVTEDLGRQYSLGYYPKIKRRAASGAISKFVFGSPI